MSKKKPPKRKKLYLVNRDFQMRYTGAAVVVGLMSTLLTITLILFPLYQFEILRIPRFLPWPILMMMAAAAMVNILLVGVMGIFITHKIAGPMYSLVRHFRMVEEGAWGGVMRQREGDDMKYVVRNFNGMITAIQDQLKSDSTELGGILSELKVDESPLATDSRKALAERLATLKQSIDLRLEADPKPDPVAK